MQVEIRGFLRIFRQIAARKWAQKNSREFSALNRSGDRRRGIFQAKLNRAAATPFIYLQTPGKVESCATVVFKRGPQRAVERTEADGVDPGSDTVSEADLEMRGPDPFRESDLGVGEDESRGRGACAEGAGILEQVHQFRRRGAGHERP